MRRRCSWNFVGLFALVCWSSMEYLYLQVIFKYLSNRIHSNILGKTLYEIEQAVPAELWFNINTRVK